jgi:VanZ family protein
MTSRRWLPPALWAGVILTITSVPNIPTPSSAGSDKLGHFVLYFVFGFLAIRTVWGTTTLMRTIATTIIALAVFAAVDEWHQSLIPRRSAELGDWVADLSGATLGVAMFALLRARRARAS